MSTALDCTNCDECADSPCFEEVLGDALGCAKPCEIPVRLTASKTFTAGQLMGQKVADGLWDVFDPLASDGTQTARGVLRYSVTTDSQGRMTHLRVPLTGSACGPYYTNVWVEGYFRIEETIGDLATALGQPGFGRLIDGSVGSPGLWKLL